MVDSKRKVYVWYIRYCALDANYVSGVWVGNWGSWGDDEVCIMGNPWWMFNEGMFRQIGYETAFDLERVLK